MSMPQDQNPFTPEKVDEQLTQLSTASSSTSQGTSSEQRLVRELQATYGAEQETVQAVERVWKRMVEDHQIAPQISQKKGRSPSMQNIQKDREHFQEQQRQPGSPRQRSVRRVFGVLAAVIVVSLFISGMLLALNASRSTNPKAQHPTYLGSGGTPRPTPPHPINGGKCSLDTHKPSPQKSHTSVPGLYIFGFYAPSSNLLYRYDPQTKKVVWSKKFCSSFEMNGTIEQNGVLYFTGVDVTQIGAKHNGWIDAFSARTGEKLWQSPAVILAGGLNELAVTSTMLYVSSRSDVGKLLAFNIQTHALVWQKTIDATHLLATSNILYVRSDVASDIQYPPEFSRLEALDGNSGKEVWQTPLNKTAGDEIVGISNGVFYWISWDTLVKDGYQGTINAFHAESGAQLWSLPTNATVGQWGGIVVI